MKICLSRSMGGLGDIVCLEPVLRTARQRFPDAYITLALPDPYVQLYLGNRTVDKVHPVKGDYAEIRKLAKQHDLWFPLEGYENKHIFENDGRMTKSRIEVWCETINPDVKDGCLQGSNRLVDDLCPHWEPRESERQACREQMKEHGIEPGQAVVVHWGSKSSAKDYPYTLDLVRLLVASGHKVMVVHDTRLPDMGGAIEVLNVPLRELGCIVEQAGLTIGPDSGISHLSAATGTPNISICSVTDGSVYFSRHYPHCLVLQNTQTEGKPCAGKAPCWALPSIFWCGRRPRQAAWCMEVYTPERLLKIIEQRLKEYENYNRERLFGPSNPTT